MDWDLEEENEDTRREGEASISRMGAGAAWIWGRGRVGGAIADREGCLKKLE